MSISKIMSGRIVHPLSLLSRGRSKEIAYTKTLSTYSSLSREELSRMVESKKTALMKHVFSNVSWYMEREASLPEVEILASDYSAWQEIPIVDRNIIGPEESKFVSACATDTTWSDTSGSTGQKFRYLMDRSAGMWSAAAQTYAYERIGVPLGSRQMVVWGAPRDIKSQSRLLHRLRMRMLRQRAILAYRLSPQKVRAILTEIEHFKPVLLRSYPNILLDLSRYDSQGVLRNPEVVITAGEWLRPNLRQKLEEVIGKKIHDWYGTREFGSIAYECSAHNGLHIFSPLVFVETIREDNTPCKPGERGEFVITSMARRSMPLIRYRTGDVGVLSNEKCSCGSSFPLISELAGRTMEVIMLPNGQSVAGYFWTHIARDTSGIDQFRIVQSKTGSIDIQVILEKGAGNDVTCSFRRVILESLGCDIDLRVSVVEELPVNQSGKTGLVISEYNPESINE